MLENIPAGEYNKITFTVGADSAGIVDGAAGGVKVAENLHHAFAYDHIHQ